MKTYGITFHLYEHSLDGDQKDRLYERGWEIIHTAGFWPSIEVTIYITLTDERGLTDYMLSGMAGIYFKQCCGVRVQDILFSYDTKLVSDV